jgi:hypothetical protein
MIDARRIAAAVLLKPFKYIGIEAHGYQFLGRTPELGELLVGERRNIGIVDPSNIRTLLPPPNAIQRRLLALS